MKHHFSVLLLSTLLIACSSTYVYKPEPISAEHSFAYNIAKQTVLTKGRSLLRDFSLQEVDETELNLNKKAGGLSMTLGALSLLTGDFTGIIDIAGGASARIATSNHTSAKPRWIVLLDKSKYQNEIEAQKEMVDLIQNTAMNVLNKYGQVSLSYNSATDSEGFDLDGIPIGVTVYRPVKDGNEIKLMDINNFQNSEFGDYYGYGFEDAAYFVGLPIPLIFNVKHPNRRIDFTQLIQEISAKLPKNYFAYLPSYPKTFYEDETGFKKYQDYSIRVPMIITEGKVHKFIKPNKDKS